MKHLLFITNKYRINRYLKTGKYRFNMACQAILILSMALFLSNCNNDDDGENGDPDPSHVTPPAWSGTPSPKGTEGVAGSYNFPELSKGEPKATCTLISGTLPSWASLSEDCILTWTDKAVAGDITGLVIEAGNSKGSVSSDPFTLSISPDEPTPQVIFLETFDQQPDWSDPKLCAYDNFSKDCETLPLNWNYLYVDDKNPTHAPCYIEASAARGGSGKGYAQWDESRGSDGSWRSECQLAKRLPQAYPELWFSFWIRFNPDAEWESNWEPSKIFRAGAYNPKVMDGTSRSTIFKTNAGSEDNKGVGRTTGGMFFLNVVRVGNGGTRIQLSARCNPSYKCGSYDNTWEYNLDPNAPSGTTDWSSTLGDGNWHRIEAHYKLNSAPGAEDGILEIFYDGNRIGGRDNIPWRANGAESWIKGATFFSIAGNSANVWAGDINTVDSPEQLFYYLDDVSVCTTRCP